MKWFQNKNLGQSLVEVVVAVGMIALLLTAVLALISLSVRNSRLAKDKTKAVGFAQEGVELIRTYRDLSWTNFSSLGGDYNLPEDWTVETPLGDSCAENNIGDIFTRCVNLTSGGDSRVVTVTVSWQEGNQLHKTVQQTNLTLWER